MRSLLRDESSLWAGLDARREGLNGRMPTRVLGDRAPLQAFPEAVHSGREYRPEWEEALLNVERVYHYLDRGRWFRQVKPNGHIKLGGYEYYLGKRLAGQAAEITFDPNTSHLLCPPGGKVVAVPVAIQGVTIDELMRELAGVVRLPTYQLALPLSPAACRQQHYAECLTGTN